MAIVLDADDLSKTLLLSSSDMALTSVLLHKSSSEDISEVKVLHSVGDDDSVPTLFDLDVTTTVEAFEAQRANFYTPPRKSAAAATNIKSEEGTDSGEEDESDGSNDVVADWSDMHRIFFEIIEAGPRSKRLFFPERASKALKQVSGVIMIATHYGAVRAIDRGFETALLKWMATNTLGAAIAKRPCPWLKVALAMEEDNILQESVVHLVGDWNSYKDKASDTGLPGAVRTLIERKAADLRLQRYQVDHKLYAITLDAATLAPSRTQRQKGTVSSTNHSLAWQVVNLFRDWIAIHLATLDQLETANICSKNARAAPNCEPSPICPKHELGKSSCLTLAGFYRILAKADDSFLTAELATKLLQDFDAQESDVRAALKALKASAAKIVEPLVEPGSKFTEAAKLEYLTCVNVEKLRIADVVEQKDEGEDEEMRD